MASLSDIRTRIGSVKNTRQITRAMKLVASANPAESEADFYESKLLTMKYFFHYEVPKTKGLATRLKDTEILTITTDKELII